MKLNQKLTILYTLCCSIFFIHSPSAQTDYPIDCAVMLCDGAYYEPVCTIGADGNVISYINDCIAICLESVNPEDLFVCDVNSIDTDGDGVSDADELYCNLCGVNNPTENLTWLRDTIAKEEAKGHLVRVYRFEDGSFDWGIDFAVVSTNPADQSNFTWTEYRCDGSPGNICADDCPYVLIYEKGQPVACSDPGSACDPDPRHELCQQPCQIECISELRWLTSLNIECEINSLQTLTKGIETGLYQSNGVIIVNTSELCGVNDGFNYVYDCYGNDKFHYGGIAGINAEEASKITNRQKLHNDCKEPCICIEIYDPVCVISPHGDEVSFSNDCYAKCAGYEESQFVTCESQNPDPCPIDCVGDLDWLSSVEIENCFNPAYRGDGGHVLTATYESKTVYIINYYYLCGGTDGHSYVFDCDGSILFYYGGGFGGGNDEEAKKMTDITELSYDCSSCNCTEVYDPVCVNGSLIKFSNECFAKCQGYDESQYVKCGTQEKEDCHDGIDNDGDGFVDFVDTDCIYDGCYDNETLCLEDIRVILELCDDGTHSGIGVYRAKYFDKNVTVIDKSELCGTSNEPLQVYGCFNRLLFTYEPSDNSEENLGQYVTNLTTLNACAGKDEICDNHIDDDRDGFADGADSECLVDVESCPENACIQDLTWLNDVCSRYRTSATNYDGVYLAKYMGLNVIQIKLNEFCPDIQFIDSEEYEVYSCDGELLFYYGITFFGNGPLIPIIANHIDVIGRLPNCEAAPEVCDNDRDDDLDGFIDLADPDCISSSCHEDLCRQSLAWIEDICGHEPTQSIIGEAAYRVADYFDKTIIIINFDQHCGTVDAGEHAYDCSGKFLFGLGGGESGPAPSNILEAIEYRSILPASCTPSNCDPDCIQDISWIPNLCFDNSDVSRGVEKGTFEGRSVIIFHEAEACNFPDAQSKVYDCDKNLIFSFGGISPETNKELADKISNRSVLPSACSAIQGADLQPSLQVSSTSYKVTDEHCHVLHINEVNGMPTTGPVKIFVSKMEGFRMSTPKTSSIPMGDLMVDVDNMEWDMTETEGGYIFETNKAVAANGELKLGMLIMAMTEGSVANLTIRIQDVEGTDMDSSNNGSVTVQSVH